MGRRRREEERMSEGEQRDADAFYLLRSLVDQLMGEKALEDEEDAVGVPVTPATLGINLSTFRYSAAIARLLDRDALMRDAETDEIDHRLSSVPGMPETVKITREGINLLRERRR
jgi:hypothetical protein